jgi:hypothetical protein
MFIRKNLSLIKPYFSEDMYKDFTFDDTRYPGGDNLVNRELSGTLHFTLQKEKNALTVPDAEINRIQDSLKNEGIELPAKKLNDYLFVIIFIENYINSTSENMAKSNWLIKEAYNEYLNPTTKSKELDAISKFDKISQAHKRGNVLTAEIKLIEQTPKNLEVDRLNIGLAEIKLQSEFFKAIEEYVRFKGIFVEERPVIKKEAWNFRRDIAKRLYRLISSKFEVGKDTTFLTAFILSELGWIISKERYNSKRASKKELWKHRIVNSVSNWIR